MQEIQQKGFHKDEEYCFNWAWLLGKEFGKSYQKE